MPRKKRDWKPATSFKVTKLKPNGPKNGHRLTLGCTASKKKSVVFKNAFSTTQKTHHRNSLRWLRVACHMCHNWIKRETALPTD